MLYPECLDWGHAAGLPGGIVAHWSNSERWHMGLFLKTRLVSSTNASGWHSPSHHGRPGVLRAMISPIKAADSSGTPVLM
jgi:hypothetical protein